MKDAPSQLPETQNKRLLEKSARLDAISMARTHTLSPFLPLIESYKDLDEKFKRKQSSRNQMCWLLSFRSPRQNLMPVIFFKTNILHFLFPPSKADIRGRLLIFSLKEV